MMQRIRILDTTAVTKNWSRLGVYSDLCVQTVRRALTHLVCTFDAELRNLTKKGIRMSSTFYLARKCFHFS